MNSTEEQLPSKLLISPLENLLEGCQILDHNWKYLYINNSAEKHNQRSKNELLGKCYMDMWPGIEKTEVFSKIKTCLENRIPQLMENEFIFPNGTSGWFELSIQPIPEGVFILSIDITEKKQALNDLLLKESRFKHVFESANVGKSITRISGEIEVNLAFSEMLGYQKEELQNIHWKEITPDEDIEKVERYVNMLMSGEQDSVRFLKRYIHKNGLLIWTDINTTLFRDKTGTPLYFITTVIDISKQKATELSLIRSEHLLKLFVEHAPAAIAMFDRDMCYLNVSRRYIEDYNIRNEDIKGKSHYDVFPDIPDRWKEIHKRCLKGESAKAEAEAFPRVNGNVDWVRWVIHPWYETDGKIGGIILFSELVTYRIRAEKALRRSEDLFNKAFYGSPAPMTIARKSDSIYIAVNNSFLNLTGFSMEEVIGKRGSDLNMIDEEQRSIIIQSFMDTGSVNNLEIKARTKIGKDLFLSISIENTEISGEECTITTLQDITGRKIFEISLKEKTEEIEAQNEEYQQLNEELIQTNEELNEAKKRAEESDKLKTAFLHNISHEIRTPMNAITGFISLLKNPDLDSDKRLRYHSIIEQSSNQLLALISDIIDIASIEAGQIKVFKSNVNINSIITLLFEQFQPIARNKGLEFKFKNTLNDGQAVVFTDETRLIQIITNLLTNAFKFTNNGFVHFGYNFKESEIEFYVEDSGIGIPYDMQEKIFDRFHQVDVTKVHQYGGSGLGLSISRGFATLLGGKIWTISEPCKGSTFYLTIPYNVD